MKIIRALALIFVIWLIAQPVTYFSYGEKEEKEEWIIKKRNEWFFGSRRAGSSGRMAEKRFEAVLATRKLKSRKKLENAATWVPMGPFSSSFGGWKFGNVSGRVSCLAKDFLNNILYLGSASGGLWKSTDDGITWSSIFETTGTQTIGAITLNPNNPNTIWVGTGENSSWCEEYFGIGLLKSTDGGATWELKNGSGLTSLENLSMVASIIVDPRDSNKIIVGGFYRDCVNGNYSTGGIYVSSDGGDSWKKRLSGYITDIAVDPDNPDNLWAGAGYSGVYKSVNGGTSWLKQNVLPTGNVGAIAVTVAPSNGNYIYALFEWVNSGPELWRTIDGGSNWSKVVAGYNACDGQCWYNLVMRVHPSNPDIIYRGTIHVFKSTNGGMTWTDLSNNWGPSQKIHQDTHALLIDPANPNIIYVGCDGGIWKTEDGGSNFKNLNGNLSLTQFYDIGIHPTDNNTIVGGAQDNSSLARTTGNTWALQEVTGDGFVSIINPQNTDIVYTASYPWDGLPSVLRSKNGIFGNYDWITTESNGFVSGDRIGWVTPYTIDQTNPDILFLGTHRIYKTADGGTTWTQIGPTDMAGGQEYVNTVNMPRNNGSYIYAGTTNSRVWQSIDGGTNWTNISSGIPSGYTINDIEPDPSTPASAFCALSGFGISHLYRYEGTSWTAKGNGLPDIPANSVLQINSTDVYVGTDVGIFKSTDGGDNFSPYQDGMPEGLITTDLEYNETTGAITAGTYGRGAWQIGGTQIIPPSISLMKKASSPFRIVVNGSNFQDGVKVYINGSLWENAVWKSAGKVVIKGGSALKSAVPKNTPVEFRFVNPDGGELTTTWQWP